MWNKLIVLLKRQAWLGDKFIDLLIVIIGITIAFQLNEWKAKSIEEKKVGVVKNEILSDLKLDEKELNRLINNQQNKLIKLERAIEMLDDTTLRGQKFFNIHQVIYTTSYFEVRKRAYEYALNTGEFYLISDKELSNKIINYYDGVSHVDFYEDNEVERLGIFNEFCTEYFLLGKEDAPESLFRNKKFLNTFQIIYYNQGLKIAEYKNLLKLNTELQSVL
ncbi:DUF6090 family protein [Flammeovirga sp. SubArs3]|uniref:DUF6090 family protein n=1 Tax=Flammeovirga sp. SubArs3 TaxID=2995316 RepID=UPI00248ACDED|nr:DUF6090 family protein [Flammeovirga sp. SubArs3]